MNERKIIPITFELQCCSIRSRELNRNEFLAVKFKSILTSEEKNLSILKDIETQHRKVSMFQKVI